MEAYSISIESKIVMTNDVEITASSLFLSPNSVAMLPRNPSPLEGEGGARRLAVGG
jgi:hypothetical protein